jgi:hypothetical protein
MAKRKKSIAAKTALWSPDEARFRGHAFLPLGDPALEFRHPIPSVPDPLERTDMRLRMGLSYRAAAVLALKRGCPVDMKWRDVGASEPPRWYLELRSDPPLTFRPGLIEARRIAVWAAEQETLPDGQTGGEYFVRRAIAALAWSTAVYFEAIEGGELPWKGQPPIPTIAAWFAKHGRPCPPDMIDEAATEQTCVNAATIATAQLYLMHGGFFQRSAMHWHRGFEGARGAQELAASRKPAQKEISQRAVAAFRAAKALNPHLSASGWAERSAHAYGVAPRTLRRWLREAKDAQGG